jgi:hypothetical protein
MLSLNVWEEGAWEERSNSAGGSAFVCFVVLSSSIHHASRGDSMTLTCSDEDNDAKGKNEK